MSCVHVETKSLWLFRAAELGDDLDGWQVCWRGGWDKCRVLFVVMVKRITDTAGMNKIPAAEHPPTVFAAQHKDPTT